MEKKIYQLAGGFLIGCFFTACEPADDSVITNEVDAVEVTVEEGNPSGKLQDASLPDYFVTQLANYENATLNTYSMEFLGRTVKGSGENITTTFNYKVSGNEATPQMDTFILEVPGCAGNLISWEPQNSSNLDTGAIRWNSSISKSGSQEYSLTYAGDIPLGVITASGIRGGVEENVKILGPCKGVFVLSGSVFIDADQDGEKEEGEFGLPGINVSLFDGNANKITTLVTAEDGSYTFMVLNGNYSISITEDFLDENYYGAGNSSVTLENVSANNSSLNFGYSVNSDKIIFDLENTISLTTQPTKFWVQELRNAGRKNSLFSKETVIGYLTAIENRPNDPFQFGTDKIGSAISILSNPIKTPYDEFIQQLLTAELNIISGRGVQFSEEERKAFHEALLTYSEGVACRENAQCSGTKLQTSDSEQANKIVSSRDTRMLSSFNGSGGI